MHTEYNETNERTKENILSRKGKMSIRKVNVLKRNKKRLSIETNNKQWREHWKGIINKI